jgi:hypothetical protein
VLLNDLHGLHVLLFARLKSLSESLNLILWAFMVRIHSDRLWLYLWQLLLEFQLHWLAHLRRISL